MSIFKVKKSGNWYYKFVYNGRQFKRSAGAGATKQEARKLGEKHLEKLKEETKLRKLGIPIDRTFGDACVQFIKQGYLAESMKSHMRCTLPHLMDTPLEEAHVDARYMAARMREDGRKDNTINRRLSVVIRVLNVAYNHWDGWLPQPTASKIQKFDESEYAREYYLSAEEVADFVDAMPDEKIKPWFLLLAYTGMRQSEMLNLEPDQWNDGCINLRSNTKSGKPRSVPVAPELQYLMDQLPCPFVYQDLRRNWEAARKQTGNGHWRIHDLRHTFASWLAKDPEVPMAVIRDILGHSTLAVTSKYANLRTAALVAATARLKVITTSQEAANYESVGTKSGTTSNNLLVLSSAKSA